MSLNTILQKIQQKGKIQNAQGNPTRNLLTTNSNGNFSAKLTKPQSRPNGNVRPSERPVDPVVARLKAARKAEKEKKEQELREKKGLLKKPKATIPLRTGKAVTPTGNSQKKNSQTGKSSNGKSLNGKSTSGRGNGNIIRQSLPSSAEPKKPKMSFSELMKKASLIDQSKMSIEIKQKTKLPDPGRNPERRKERPAQSRPGQNRSGQNRLGLNRSGQSRPGSGGRGDLEADDNSKAGSSQVRAPLPSRKPLEKLQQKLKRPDRQDTQGRQDRAGYNDESEDDWSSFIASDEEEQVSHSQDYDRDEIWSMFNKGRKRLYYDRYDDEDSDDMEATGAEILEEEMRSKRRAVEEDKRELAEEQRLAALKQARKKR